MADPSFEDIGEDSLSLFDDFLHENYGAPESMIGEVILCRDEDTFFQFREWALSSRRPIAFDTENTGLYQYEPGFEAKLVQWGDTETAYVFVWGDPWYKKSIDFIMNETDCVLLAHNSTYDALVLDSLGMVNALELLERTRDTYILSHLADPRGIKDGSTGHKLAHLSWRYVDESAPDSDLALNQLFKSMGWKKGSGYRLIPKTHPTLIQYAGMDVIVTARLYPVLVDLVERGGMTHLIAYEHRLLYLCAILERRGMLVDREFAEDLHATFDKRRADYLKIVLDYGVLNPESTDDVAAALRKTGEVLVDTTESGRISVDKKVMEAIIEREGPGAKLAEAIIGAKNALKWRKAYVSNTLDRLDDQGRVHAKINSLMARTARMSVGEPPLQQIPSSFADIRHMFLAEEGCRTASIDFSGVELRVLAALSRDPTMLNAFEENLDLHQITADSAKVPRSVGKMTNFAKVFGGGATTIARQAGISIQEAERVVKGFGRTYPGVGLHGKKLSRPVETGQRPYVTTYSNRRLPVDKDRAYSALNYVVQSTARDVLGKAMIHVWNAGLWDYVMMPIHDELLCSVPEAEAEDLCRQIGVIMETEIEGVHLPTEPDLGGRSWGTMYEHGDMHKGGIIPAQHRVIELTEADRLCYAG